MSNLEEFKKDASRTISLLHIVYPDLVDFTKDNSFVIMLEKLCNVLLSDIGDAIVGKELATHSGIERDIDRYIKTVASSAEYRVPYRNIIEALKKVNIIFLNWLRLIGEQDISYYKINMDTVKKNIEEINGLLDMSFTVDRLVNVANKLINKAESVLAAAPKSFNLSRHFADAMKKELED